MENDPGSAVWKKEASSLENHLSLFCQSVSANLCLPVRFTALQFFRQLNLSCFNFTQLPSSNIEYEPTHANIPGNPGVRLNSCHLAAHISFKIVKCVEMARRDRRYACFPLQPLQQLAILEGQHPATRVIDHHELHGAEQVM